VQEIASTRLLVASNGGMLRHCVSPDLQADELAIVFEGNIDPTAYGEALDELLMLRFDFSRPTSTPPGGAAPGATVNPARS
jgi:hypothetical protein